MKKSKVEADLRRGSSLKSNRALFSVRSISIRCFRGRISGVTKEKPGRPPT